MHIRLPELNKQSLLDWFEESLVIQQDGQPKKIKITSQWRQQFWPALMTQFAKD